MNLTCTPVAAVEPLRTRLDEPQEACYLQFASRQDLREFVWWAIKQDFGEHTAALSAFSAARCVTVPLSAPPASTTG